MLSKEDREKIENYNGEKFEKVSHEAISFVKLRYNFQLTDEADLSYKVMDFVMMGMLSQVISDAKQHGFEWGEKYLDYLLGPACILRDNRHPALYSLKAREIAFERLIAELSGIKKG